MKFGRVLFYVILFVFLSSCRKPSQRDRSIKQDIVLEESVQPEVEEEEITEELIEEEQHEESISANIPNIEDEILLSRPLVDMPEQLLQRTGYILSYNSKTKNANWVSWHLTKEHTTGSWSRQGYPYMVDDDVKGARQELEDWYGHSLPIDHGHMCPAGDCKWSKDVSFPEFSGSSVI